MTTLPARFSFCLFIGLALPASSAWATTCAPPANTSVDPSIATRISYDAIGDICTIANAADFNLSGDSFAILIDPLPDPDLYRAARSVGGGPTRAPEFFTVNAVTAARGPSFSFLSRNFGPGSFTAEVLTTLGGIIGGFGYKMTVSLSRGTNGEIGVSAAGVDTVDRVPAVPLPAPFAMLASALALLACCGARRSPSRGTAPG